MIGRQNLYIGRNEFRGILREVGLGDDSALAGCLSKSGDFADPFFRALGAQTVESMDASDFEGATIIHDLNEPVRPELQNRFELVFDGGTIEHVFNLPVAILNLMQMTKLGGHLILHTPANNYMGHGFYQLSAEFFFRVLSEPNGFRMQRCIACEYGPKRRWYSVVDPLSVKARGQVINRYPIALYVEARKEQATPAALTTVQQSDYALRWDDHAQRKPVNRRLADMHSWFPSSLRSWLLESFPSLVRVLERTQAVYLSRACTLRNGQNYRRLLGPTHLLEEGTSLGRDNLGQ
jgi:hypothetical protein